MRALLFKAQLLVLAESRRWRNGDERSVSQHLYLVLAQRRNLIPLRHGCRINTEGACNGRRRSEMIDNVVFCHAESLSILKCKRKRSI